MFREIAAADLSAIPGLLCEGFPSTTRRTWENALDVLSRRAPVHGLPRYGHLIERDNQLCGVMLMVSHRRESATFCNLSSWYVRESQRGLASFLLGHCLGATNVTYLDCSPTPAVVPIARKFGFRPYTGGALLLDARAALRPGPMVHELTPGRLATCHGTDRARIEEHLACGCRGVLAHDADGGGLPLLYRVARLKRRVPVARFVYGAPNTIVEHAGSLMRHLVARAIPIALVDWPAEADPPFGVTFRNYGVRYVRGDHAPEIGDLLDTELALFEI